MQIRSKNPKAFSKLPFNISFQAPKKQEEPQPLAQIIIPTHVSSKEASNATTPSSQTQEPVSTLNIQGIMASFLRRQQQ